MALVAQPATMLGRIAKSMWDRWGDAHAFTPEHLKAVRIMLIQTGILLLEANSMAETEYIGMMYRRYLQHRENIRVYCLSQTILGTNDICGRRQIDNLCVFYNNRGARFNDLALSSEEGDIWRIQQFPSETVETPEQRTLRQNLLRVLLQKVNGLWELLRVDSIVDPKYIQSIRKDHLNMIIKGADASENVSAYIEAYTELVSAEESVYAQMIYRNAMMSKRADDFTHFTPRFIWRMGFFYTYTGPKEKRYTIMAALSDVISMISREYPNIRAMDLGRFDCGDFPVNWGTWLPAN